ncbi:MraY family glycosyltransferase [Magnetospirillum molischianum]
MAVTPAAALVWIGVAVWGGNAAFLTLATLALGLMGLSWLDDRYGLPPLPRFAAHALAVAIGLLLLGSDQLVFQGMLPLWADRLLAGLGWLWFVNLYNFMDGIDGITGTETACLGLGIAGVTLIAGLGLASLPFAAALAAAAMGFLVWNWPPARIFLGDCGSIPLGYLLGALLVGLAAQGELAAALILPGYYLADATITLLWRLVDGERIWQPHRRHFYQRAVRGGRSHAEVTVAILTGNLALIGWAVLAAAGSPVWAGAGAVLTVAALLTLLSRWAGGILR